MSSEVSMPATPIACDMTDAPDTMEERMAEWARLFATAYAGRERTAEGVRWRFRAHEGVEEWLRDLAVREKACCPFLDLTVTAAAAGEVHWHVTMADDGVDEEMVRTLMDEFYDLPDVVGDGLAGMESRLNERGVAASRNASGTVMHFQHAPTDA